MIARNDSNSIRVACFSVAVLDYFCLQDEYYAGGNALNQAVHFSRQGITSAFVGALGTDVPGDRLVSLMKAHAVDTSHLHRLEGETASNWIRNDESGERFGVEGSWSGGVYEHFRISERDWEFLADFQIWSTHVNCPNFEETLRRKSADQCLTMDFLHYDNFDLLERSLEQVDIAFVGGVADMAESLRSIAGRTGKLLVLTLGADGSIAFIGNDQHFQEAQPIDWVVDTTGCGDAFQAVFTCAYIRTGDVRDSLLAGSQAGCKAAMSHGALPWHA